MYFFGNTSVLSVLKSSFLESLSRTYQISLTFFWGEFGLPVPRKHKVRMNLKDLNVLLSYFTV